MSTPVHPSTEPFVSVEALAHLLNVPTSWVYERTARGAIPHYKVGRYVRFRVSEVLDWLTTEERRRNG